MNLVGFLSYWTMAITIVAMFACAIAAFIIGLVATNLCGGIAGIEARLAPCKRGRKVELTGPMAQLAERFPRLGELLEARMRPKPWKRLTAGEREELEAQRAELETLLPSVERRNALVLKVYDITVIAATVVAIIVAILAVAGVLVA